MFRHAQVRAYCAPLLSLAVSGLLLSGCVNHIRPYTPKQRQYELPVAQPSSTPQLAGSLFNESGVAVRLMTDPRAHNINDLVVITIDERATAQRNTSTEMSRSDSYTAQLTSFLGLIAQLQQDNPNFNGNAAMSLASDTQFGAEGRTSRNERFEATVPALVRSVLPNGNMFVEGHRVVMVNNEEHHFYISGVIRPEDIDGGGSVASSRMADAQIEFVGRGDLTTATNKGWFSRLLDYIWPF